MHRIAVLITCHNRKQKTLRCLSHLYASQLAADSEIFVFLVDDGSTDGTADAVITEFPDVNVIPGNGSLFWNRGMHKAWASAEASGDYDAYLWLNDDTLIFPHALNCLMSVAGSFQNDAVVVGSVSNENNPDEIIYGGRDHKGNLIIPSSSAQECACFNGNIVYVPEAVYDIIGKNDAYFHHSLGDFDYGMRAAKAGIKSYIAPDISGVCAPNVSGPGKWNHPATPLSRRLSLLYNPNGIHPVELMVFESRHYGILKALFHFFTIHVRAFFPGMWHYKTNKL